MKIEESGPIKQQDFSLDRIGPDSRKRGNARSAKGMQFCQKCGKVMTNGQWAQHKSRCQG